MGKKLNIIEVNSGLGAAVYGESMGIDALKSAAIEMGSDLFNTTKTVIVPTENHLLFQVNKSLYAKHIDGIHTVCERVAPAVYNSLKNNEFPIILAGDHTTAAATIAGIKMAYPHKRLGVIWLDAHADIHSPWTTPSGNMHGMPLAIALNEDNISNKKNKPDSQTLEYWEKLKTIGGPGPKIKFSDLVYIALRDIEPEESSLLKKHNVKIWSTHELRNAGAATIAEKTLSYLSDCNMIYISFDVDALDPSISKGTGVPSPHGITPIEANNLIVQLVQDKRVCCLEIAEINPMKDTENNTAKKIFEILQQVVEQLNS